MKRADKRHAQRERQLRRRRGFSKTYTYRELVDQVTLKNLRGYQDPTPFEAIKNLEGTREYKTVTVKVTS